MPKQIGWSNESNLLYTISSQISRLAGIIATSGGGGGGGGTITGGGASGQVTFWNGATSITGSNNLFWDAANSRLGIGTNTPSYPLHIRTSSRFGFAYECTDDTANQNYLFLYRNSATPAANDGIGTVILEGNNSSLVRSTYAYFGGRIISSAAASHSGELYFATTNGGTEADKLVIKPTGNVLIQNGGTFTDDLTNRLQVTGNARITGLLSVTNPTTNSFLAATFKSFYSATGAIATDNGAVWLGIGGSDYYSNAIVITTNNTVSLRTNGSVRFSISSIGEATFNSDVSIAGVLRETVTTNRQTASYTLVLADRGKLVETNVGAANTITVPPNSSITFPIGTKIDIAQYGAGQTTIVPGIGVTVRSAGGALKLSAQYSGATIVKIGTDEWYLFGDITV